MRLVLNIVLLSVLALVPLFVSIPSYSPLFESLNDSAHALLFLTIGLGAFVGFKLPPPTRESLLIWLVFLAALLSLGIIIEIVQSFIGRSATLSDVLLDGLGIAAAASLYWAWVARGSARLLLVISAFIALVAAFNAPIRVIWHAAQLTKQLPIICDFDGPCPALSGVDGAKVQVQKAAIQAQKTAIQAQKKSMPADDLPILWRNNASFVLRISYPVAEYPGGGFDQVAASWQGFDELCAQVYWPYLSAGRLGIHIHDQRFKKTREKFDRTYGLNAGANEVCIELADVTQKVDLTGVKTLVYYIPRPGVVGEFYVDNIRLR